LQSLKSGLANRHLADETLSISEIPWLVGYQHVSAFTHAFQALDRQGTQSHSPSIALTNRDSVPETSFG
jgi:transcriptional regulator GlxA family with amidase domain